MARKRGPLSEETKRKIAESLKGRTGHKHSEETKRLMAEKARERHIKNPEANLAKLKKANDARGPVTDETRKKLSEANHKRFQDPNERAKVTHEWTDEERAAASIERSKRWENPEYRERVIAAHVGKKRNIKTKAKIADKAKERWADPEFKKKMESINKAAAQKRDMSGANNGMYGRGHTYETKVKMAEALSKRLKDNQTPLELEISRILDSVGIQYEKQKVIGFYVVDFYIPGINLIIEADGGWHNEPERKESDKKRDIWLRSEGYNLVRITQDEIKRNVSESVMLALIATKQQ